MEVLNAIFGSKENKCCSSSSSSCSPSEDAIREIAYFRWLEATGGSPVSEEESQKFWVEAEKELQNA